MIEKKGDNFSFTKKIRIVNILLYGMTIISMNFANLLVLSAYLFYSYLCVILLFLVLELRFMLLTKINPIKHILSNWLVLLGFTIILFNIVKFVINR